MHQITLDPRQIDPLLKVLTDNDPDLDYREMAALSVLLSDVRDLKAYGEIRWRAEAEAAKKIREMEEEPLDPAKPLKSFKHKLYNYSEVIDYIEKKYGISTRGYKRDVVDPEAQKQYRDFWHWMLETNTPHKDGSVIYVSEDWRPEDGPWWVVEILELIVKEFFPGHNWDEDFMSFWCEW